MKHRLTLGENTCLDDTDEIQGMSRPDPCSVDFGRETPKFRFLPWILGRFFPPVSPNEQGPDKIHCKIHPGLCSEKFPSDFLQKPFLEDMVSKLMSSFKDTAAGAQHLGQLQPTPQSEQPSQGEAALSQSARSLFLTRPSLCGLTWYNFVKVERLQSEFCTKDLF